MKNFNTDWYFFPLLLVILVLVVTSASDFGVITMGPLLLLAYWLMEKAFGGE